MSLALTVFGVTGKSADPALCYVLLRSVRGPGEYPAPTLSKSVRTDGVGRIAIPDTSIELITYDEIVPVSEEPTLLSEMGQGRFVIPAKSPIAAGQIITANPFGPLIVEESPQRFRISGNGLLYRKGIATDAPFKILREALDAILAPGVAPNVLQALIATIAAQSGVDELFKRRRQIGVVDYFYRAATTAPIDGPLFDLVPEKPDFRTKAPMLRAHIRRHAARLDREFGLQITLGNYDDVLSAEFLKIEAGVREVIVSANVHITDISLKVFDSAGQLVDQLDGKFGQAINFGLSALGAVDVLPPPFPGASKSGDLEARPRVHTVSFQGPSIADRSGGLDVLRKLDASVANWVGPFSAERENIWFEKGTDGQLEVIRWIKKKIEQPGMTKAYFIDPYLGSEALQRVIARQGNETAELVILVSPGKFDPDADAEATTGGNDFLAKLTEKAAEWADKLAGRISIVHVRRGDGSRQAFHDRYLCVIDQKGVPTAYLFSNSLSKAAGDWPFAICELDRVMSWRVYAYILKMAEDHAEDRDLEARLIWKSADSRVPSAPAVATAASIAKPAWVSAADAFLGDIWAIIIRNSEFKPQVGARVQAFLRDWSADIDMEKFADALFKVVSHRDAIVVFVSDRLREAGKGELANMLDDRLLERFLSLLPEADRKGGWFVPFDARRGVLENLGKTIARKEDATNFVRAKLNPKVYEFISVIETQRFDQTAAWNAHEAGLFLSIVALEVAIEAEAKAHHRTGLATDYIHWLGRFMRSDVAASVYVALDTIPPEWCDDLIFAAQTVATARRTLGAVLDIPLGRLMNDPLVAPTFQTKLSSFLTNGGTATIAPE